MYIIVMSNSITIPRSRVKSAGGVVILPLSEYKRLLDNSVPTYYLSGKAALEADKMVEEGLREYHAGKTRKLKSLADLD